MHSGLSHRIDTIDQINLLDRFECVEPTYDEAIYDLLMSNPDKHQGWQFMPYTTSFGQDVSEKFNHTNGMKCIARSRSLMKDGYEWMHGDNLVTVYSAPNYCQTAGNKGAFMEIDENVELNIT